MRYVPNLLPDSLKILPDYFKGSIYTSARKPPFMGTILWILGIIFFLFALAYLPHPLVFLLFFIIAVMLIPPGHRFLERKLRFRLTPRIKTIATSALFIGALPLAGHYNDVDRQEAAHKKLLAEKAEKEKAIADQKEQQRKDSLNYYLQLSSRFAKEHRPGDANKQLQYAQSFASLPEENNKIEQGKVEIKSVQVIDLVKSGKYQTALPEIQNLLLQDPANSELLYNKALCKSKTGNIQEAVTDLKQLVDAGNTDAIALHNKINPIRKRVAYYVTRCCDGSTSGATGRGACSHHGGVCNWSDPVYEEYRKYE